MSQPPPAADARTTTGFRFAPATLRQIEAIQLELAKRLAPVRVTRSDAVAWAINKAMEGIDSHDRP